MTTYLGLDYGLRRIGIAVGDDETYIALSLGTHVEGRDGSVLAHLEQLVAERRVKTIVVGLPLTAAGGEGEIAVRARRFAALLPERCGVSVEFWDERYTSQEADRWLAAKQRPSKEDRDSLAAEIILQGYLDHLRSGGEGDGE